MTWCCDISDCNGPGPRGVGLGLLSRAMWLEVMGRELLGYVSDKALADWRSVYWRPRSFFACLEGLSVWNERFQRRHSALRTIKGGICCGLTFAPPGRTQLLLLGYHWIVNSSGFKGILCLLSLGISLSASFLEQPCGACTLLLSVDPGDNFCQLSLNSA